jgi:hypothetical protein
VGVFVTPCLGTNFKATAAKKLPPLGPIFTAAPGNWDWDGGVGSCVRSPILYPGALPEHGGGGGGVPVALGSFLARADVPWVPMGSDKAPPIWLQIRGWFETAVGAAARHCVIGGSSHYVSDCTVLYSAARHRLITNSYCIV